MSMLPSTFPHQGLALNTTLWITTVYEPLVRVLAQCVRHDTAAPGHMLLQLADGRILLARECQRVEEGNV